MSKWGLSLYMEPCFYDEHQYLLASDGRCRLCGISCDDIYQVYRLHEWAVKGNSYGSIDDWDIENGRNVAYNLYNENWRTRMPFYIRNEFCSLITLCDTDNEECRRSLRLRARNTDDD